MFPIDYQEPPNICSVCGKSWDGNPYLYETDNHEFPCPDCAQQENNEMDILADVLVWVNESTAPNSSRKYSRCVICNNTWWDDKEEHNLKCWVRRLKQAV